jgi:hypothetical protein
MFVLNIVHPPKRLALLLAAAAGIFLLSSVSANPARALGFSARSGGPESGTAPATSAPYAAAGQAGFGPLDPSPPKDLTADQIVKKFGERESAFAQARNQYTYRQTVKVDTINDDTGKPDGEYQQVTDVVFSDAGARTEHVVFAPANTIQKVIMSQADFDDIQKRLPFVLTTPELPEYDLTYLGRQKVDDIDTYVFDCRPKVLEKGKRYFQGKVWVDQLEYEIVLINGKAVPDNLKAGHEDLSPPYTTYYQEVDGGNWFPVYTKADGVLHFPAGYGYLQNDVHLRYVVKYEDYKRFHAKSRIIYNGEDLPPADPNAKPGAPAAAPAPTPDASPSALPPPDPDAPPLTRPAPTPTPKPN